MTDSLQGYSSKIGASILTRIPLQQHVFGLLAAATETAIIILASVGTGVLYHYFAYHDPGRVTDYIQVGMTAALLYLIPCLYRNEYTVTNHLNFEMRPGQFARYWTFAFICLVTLGFLSKTSVLYSRGWLVLFYATGLLGITLVYSLRVQALNAAGQLGLISTQRLFLVGQETHVRDFIQRYKLLTLGFRITGIAYLSAPAEHAVTDASQRLAEDLDVAVARARTLGPDSIFVIAPWSDQSTIDRCIDAFMALPCSISLAPERILDRFENISIEKIGPISSLHLLHPPMSPFSAIIKRVFDFAVAATALVLLLPLFIVVATLIRLDSPGPVVFRQQRYGFNQKSFWIFKFRTMTTLESGMNAQQAGRYDSRVTRVGRFLRRWSIDELPQIVNVLLGEMSLVGPRPHALAHDKAWGSKIALYARRHNVKPGITGWAQINGFRGGIDTDEQLRGRILCDLYYIDNWSIWFDLRILFATIVSRAAHRNAY